MDKHIIFDHNIMQTSCMYHLNMYMRLYVGETAVKESKISIFCRDIFKRSK
jgi:hypothetical protein